MNDLNSANPSAYLLSRMTRVNRAVARYSRNIHKRDAEKGVFVMPQNDDRQFSRSTYMGLNQG